MSDDTEPVHRTYWERWTEDRGPFYRSCAVFPFDSLSEPESEQGEERPAVQFTTGITRLLLRNLPTVLLVVLAIYVPTSLLGAMAAGRVEMSIPHPGVETLVLVLPGLVVGCLWLYLVYRIAATSVGRAKMYRTVVFFLTALPLVAGTGYAVYSAWVTAGTEAEPAITVQAGYFLAVLVAGHLTYDGLALRAENLFAKLESSKIVDESAYREFRADLAATLGDTLALGPVELPRSAAFAGAVALVPMALPLVSLQWNVFAKVAFVPYSVVTLLVIAIAYDSFVLIHQFTELLRSDVLEYRPFHPDEHGGFRDLGRFATRVNLVLLVVGGYVAYRFYAEGLFVLPSDGFARPLVALTWGVSYLAPIVAYVFFVSFWLYHSFWRLHNKMEKGRKRRIEELQQQSRGESESAYEFSDPEVDGPAWESLQSAPKWPIKRQGLFGIVLLDAIPVLVPLVL
ncbi:MAG: hypothetical protein ABEJ90_00700 [Halobacterium sp.]